MKIESPPISVESLISALLRKGKGELKFVLTPGEKSNPNKKYELTPSKKYELTLELFTPQSQNKKPYLVWATTLTQAETES